MLAVALGVLLGLAGSTFRYAEGAAPDQLAAALRLQRRAQWRLDFIAAENSMEFHAPQEVARVLGEAIDYARQGQVAAMTAAPTAASTPGAAPAAPTPPVGSGSASSPPLSAPVGRRYRRARRRRTRSEVAAVAAWALALCAKRRFDSANQCASRSRHSRHDPRPEIRNRDCDFARVTTRAARACEPGRATPCHVP